MNRTHATIVALMTGLAAMGAAPTARADDDVTYEVSSDVVTKANVEYYDQSARVAQQQVSLPWQITVRTADPTSPTINGAEIRADWRPQRWRYKYVTVRIYQNGKILCESTLDVGDATCYGSTPHRSFPQTGGE